MTQQSTGPLLRLARWHESNNDLEAAAAQYAESLRHDPDSVQVLLRLGSILHRLGRYDGAVDAFTRAVELAPMSAEASGNLAVALAAAGRVADAAAASARAAVLAPDTALIQCNYGDALMAQGKFAAAGEAYRRAVALQPDAPEALNKLACALRALDEHDAAGELLDKALALAPTFGLALVNRGTLEALRHNPAKARSLLQQALALPALAPDARAEAVMTLEMIGEHERLQPALVEAVERANPETLRRAVMATRADLLPADAAFIARMTEMAQKLEAARDAPSDFARAGAMPPFWPALEAHFTYHRSEHPDGVREALMRSEEHPHSAPGTPASDDLIAFERAVRQRRAIGMPAGDAVTWEAYLRYWHATIAWHRPGYLPGQFKPVANFTADTPLFRLVRPGAVAGTLRAFHAGPYAAVPPGPCRAALVLAALGEIHAFVNGNGRLARFLLNAELESAGFQPIVLSRELMARYQATLPAQREQADACAVLAVLATASRQTGELLRTAARAS